MPDDPGGLIIPDLDMRVTIGKSSHFSDLYMGFVATVLLRRT